MYHIISEREENYELTNEEVVKIAAEVFNAMMGDRGFVRFDIRLEEESNQVKLGIYAIPPTWAKIVNGELMDVSVKEHIAIDAYNGSLNSNIRQQLVNRGKKIAEMLYSELPDVVIRKSW